MADTLQTLLDKRELDELIHRTMHAMDSHDWPGYRAGLVADAEFDFTDHGVATDDANDVMKGADNFVAILASVIEGFDATQHIVTNILHQLDGDRATTSCYVLAEHFLNNDRGDRNVGCGGRYTIDTRRTPEGWRIARLKFTTSWFRGNTSLYQLAGEAVAKRKQA
jgi:hypothetical protein